MEEVLVVKWEDLYENIGVFWFFEVYIGLANFKCKYIWIGIINFGIYLMNGE